MNTVTIEQENRNTGLLPLINLGVEKPKEKKGIIRIVKIPMQKKSI